MTLLTVDAKLFPTRNGLPEPVRSRVAGLLNRRLADAIDLQAQCKQAHWNVKGPQFIALHGLFDRIHLGIAESADLIAERVVQLGGVAEGTVRIAAERSELDEYPAAMSNGADHTNTLAASLAAFGSRMRSAVQQTGEIGDVVSADICTGIARGVDKWLWNVEAHVHTR